MNKSSLERNQFQLKGKLGRKGYDWWWHNFTAIEAETQTEQAFFIEYFLMNPKINPNQVQFGSTHDTPTYAMMKVGAWGQQAKQVHNFYPWREVSIQNHPLQVQFGQTCFLSETHMTGSCIVSEADALSHPEWFSDAGSMSWDIQIHKKVAYHVGYGASRLMRALQAFEMFWHAEGIITEYSGTVIWQGKTYVVKPKQSYGYADKNWGSNFTSPWLWISSCDFYSEIQQKALDHSAIEVGGGRPKVFGIALHKKLLMGLYYEGKMYDFNFSKFWHPSYIDFNFTEGETHNTWNITAKQQDIKLKLTLNCPKTEMLKIRYESPDGQMRHQQLWNGGTAMGTLEIYDRRQPDTLIDRISIKHAGCEYGEYTD